jgi:rifampin ADP-ribosylating transferase
MTDPDTGPFFHGTTADLRVGRTLTAGFTSNYKDGLVMNHIYFTALSKVAGLAAEIAKGPAIKAASVESHR